MAEVVFKRVEAPILILLRNVDLLVSTSTDSITLIIWIRRTFEFNDSEKLIS